MSCANNCGHPSCTIDELIVENKMLLKKMEILKEDLHSMQIWMLCSFVTCVLMAVYKIIG